MLALSVIESIHPPPQPHQGSTQRIVDLGPVADPGAVLVETEVFPVTYTKPEVDLVMEAEISVRGPLQVDTTTLLMAGNPEPRGHIEASPLLKDRTDLPTALTIRAIRTIQVLATTVEAEVASEAPI